VYESESTDEAEVLSTEELESIAKLARIDTNVDGERIHKDVLELLSFVRTIHEVDVSGVEPLRSPLELPAWRQAQKETTGTPAKQGDEEVLQQHMPREELLSLSHNTQDVFYRVPKQ